MKKQNLIYPALLIAMTSSIFNFYAYGQVTVTVNPAVVIDTVRTKGGSNHTGLTSFTYSSTPSMVNDLQNIPYKLNRLHFSGDLPTGIDLSRLPQTSPTTWNFFYMDSVVNVVDQIRNMGNNDFIMAISLCPTWMTAGGIDSGGAPVNYSVFAQYAARLVRYYNQGSFFDGTNTITNPNGIIGIQYWDIWNEPDQNYIQGIDTAVFTATEYANLFKIVSDSMRAADPAIKIGGPNTSWMHSNYVDTLFLSGAQVDFVSIHDYPAAASDTDSQVFQMADTPASVSIPPNMPLMIGEINALSDWNDSRMSSVFELAYMPLAYKAHIMAGTNNVIRWETVEDAFPVLNLNGSKHRNYWMEKYFWTVSDSGSQVISCNSSVPNEISCLAVKTSSGKVKVVLINKAVANLSDINGAGVSRTITINGLPAGNYETAVIDTLTNPVNGPVINTNTPSSITIDGYGVAVIAQDGFTGMEDEIFLNSADIKIYPNPANQTVNLVFDNSKKENCTLTLYDIKGQLVQTITNITTNQVTIEAKNLTSGFYFLQLQTDKQIIATEKLTIE